MIDYGTESQAGPRPYNEDSQLIRDLSPFSERLGGLLVFMIVSDGMGGHQAGDVASRLAVEAADSYVDRLVHEAGRTIDTLDPEAMLADIADAADRAILAEAQERGGASMGATFVALFATADRAWIGHIGDSRAYLLRGDNARQLTADHSQVGRMIAEGVLTEEQAQQHPNRNVIERALGFGDGRGPDTAVVDLERDDVLLLCTDGMSTVLTGGDLADIVSSSRNLRDAARELVNEAIRLGSDDNTTVALWAPNRRARTIPDRGRRVDSSRRKAREKRTAQRHARASRASYYVAAALAAVLVGGVAWVTVGAGIGGGGSSGAGSTAASIESTPRPAPQPSTLTVFTKTLEDGPAVIRPSKGGEQRYTRDLEDGIQLTVLGPWRARTWLETRLSTPTALPLTDAAREAFADKEQITGYVYSGCLSTSAPAPKTGQ